VPGARVLLCIGMEKDPNTGFTPRNLVSGSGAQMAFNLYTDPARSTIWGSTNSSSGYAPVPIVLDFGPEQYSLTGTTALYGRVNSAGQTGLPAGQYEPRNFPSYSWGGKVAYKLLAAAEPIDCFSGSITERNFSVYISARVEKDCRIDAATTMDFGTVFMELSQNVDSIATITGT